MINSQYIDEFVDAARSFCSWLEKEPYDDESDRFTALVLLSSLYSAALHLPEISDKSLPPGGNPAVRDDKLSNAVMNRLDRFPFRYYWRVEKTSEDTLEKIEDDMARDLFLTYAAVKSSLLVFDQGSKYRDAAVWSWCFSFWLDWGRHCTNAIQALHAQFHEQLNRDE